MQGTFAVLVCFVGGSEFENIVFHGDICAKVSVLFYTETILTRVAIFNQFIGGNKAL